MARVTVHIISTDNKALRGINTGYLREPPYRATVRSAKASKQDAMYEFYEAIENEEEKLGSGVASIYASISPSTTPGFRWSAIFRKIRRGNVELRPLTGEIDAGETPLQAAVREFGEELGSTIDARFFTESPTDPNTFFVRVDAAAKSLLLENHSDLDPFTEFVNIGWVNLPQGLVVPPNAAVLMTANIVKHPDSIMASTVRRTFQDLRRVAKTTAESVLGRGRTIRWKKLKRSKKRGTLKRGVRR